MQIWRNANDITTELYGCSEDKTWLWLYIIFLRISLSIPIFLSIIYLSIYRWIHIYAHTHTRAYIYVCVCVFIYSIIYTCVCVCASTSVFTFLSNGLWKRCFGWHGDLVPRIAQILWPRAGCVHAAMLSAGSRRSARHSEVRARHSHGRTELRDRQSGTSVSRPWALHCFFSFTLFSILLMIIFIRWR